MAAAPGADDEEEVVVAAAPGADDEEEVVVAAAPDEDDEEEVVVAAPDEDDDDGRGRRTPHACAGAPPVLANVPAAVRGRGVGRRPNPRSSALSSASARADACAATRSASVMGTTTCDACRHILSEASGWVAGKGSGGVSGGRPRPHFRHGSMHAAARPLLPCGLAGLRTMVGSTRGTRRGAAWRRPAHNRCDGAQGFGFSLNFKAGPVFGGADRRPTHRTSAGGVGGGLRLSDGAALGRATPHSPHPPSLQLGFLGHSPAPGCGAAPCQRGGGMAKVWGPGPGV